MSAPAHDAVWLLFSVLIFSAGSVLRLCLVELKSSHLKVSVLLSFTSWVTLRDPSLPSWLRDVVILTLSLSNWLAHRHTPRGMRAHTHTLPYSPASTISAPTDVAQYLGQFVFRWVVSNACISLGFQELIQWASQLWEATPERPEVQLFVIITDSVRLRIPNSIKVRLITAATRFRLLLKSTVLKINAGAGPQKADHMTVDCLQYVTVLYFYHMHQPLTS